MIRLCGAGVLVRDSRKSIYLAGLSQVPSELDETRPFRPDVESTRLGELSYFASGIFPFVSKSTGTQLKCSADSYP
jgi:hypothetical protein